MRRQVAALQERSKAPGDFDVVEVGQVVADIDVIQRLAEAAQGHAETIGAAEAAELSAAFDVWFQVQEDAALAWEAIKRAKNRPRPWCG